MAEMLNHSPEINIKNINSEVTSPLGMGAGSIDTEPISDEEAHEQAGQAREYIRSVEDMSPCGCIDGRCVHETLAGTESTLGPKLAGGEATSAFAAIILTGIGTQSAETMMGRYEYAVRMLEATGHPVRIHGDTDHLSTLKDQLVLYRQQLADIQSTDEYIDQLDDTNVESTGTGCGMNDGLIKVFGFMTEHPQVNESANDVLARLAYMQAVTRAIVGDVFDETVFQRHIQHATVAMASISQEWKSEKVIAVVDRVLQDQRASDSVESREELLDASGGGVHGHQEAMVGINNVPGTTLDMQAYVAGTGKQMFWVDAWRMSATADVFTAGPDAVAHKSEFMQAIALAQAAAAYTLTTGRQRAAVYTAHEK